MFYRATHMHIEVSAHSAVSCGAVSDGLCLSVCLSVTVVYCVGTTKATNKQLAVNCSPRTPAYGHQTWNMYL